MFCRNKHVDKQVKFPALKAEGLKRLYAGALSLTAKWKPLYSDHINVSWKG